MYPTQFSGNLTSFGTGNNMVYMGMGAHGIMTLQRHLVKLKGSINALPAVGSFPGSANGSKNKIHVSIRQRCIDKFRYKILGVKLIHLTKKNIN